MSKYISSLFMNAYLDMESDYFDGKISPENKEIWEVIQVKSDEIEERFETLCSKMDKLNNEQLAELKDLKDSIDEFNELKAQRLTNEERQQYIDNLTSRGNDLPLIGRLWLDALTNYILILKP